ncbi:hypothetical protein ACL00X_12490 [Aeromonas diversa]|uniref:hypothetical protein n=1 Tax=Aeromonas diversa TaxID=502790 RepID=UPI0039A3A564
MNRPRLARLFMLLTALLVLHCTLQPALRMAAQFDAPVPSPGPWASDVASDDVRSAQTREATPSPCSLIGKLLSAAQWSAITPLLLALWALSWLALFAPPRLRARLPLIPISPPERRLHLTLCNFRE